ncbi:MAG: GtrA family protein [Muricoprocola sp.]
MIEKIFVKHGEMISYLFWGAMTTVVSWGSYALFFRSLGGILTVSSAVTAANVLSWLCAILFAFAVNKQWVFRSRSWKRKIWWPEFVKFVSSRIVTGILEIAGVPLLVKMGLDFRIMGIDGMLAKIMVSVVVVILNYFFGKFLVFRKKK